MPLPPVSTTYAGLPFAATLLGPEVVSLQQNGVTLQTTAAAIAGLGQNKINFANQLIVGLAAGSQDFGASPPIGYVQNTTNQLILNANSGDSTLAGLLAGQSGFSLLIFNSATVGNIIFAHQQASLAANQFTCPQGQAAILPPFTGVIISYVNSIGWIFL